MQNEISLRALANEFGTPLYIYHSEMMQENFSALKNLFPKNVDLFYSLKANPNVQVCSVFQKKGAGAEVCSLVELEIAILSGYKPENIIFVGPAKNAAEIERALDLNIYAIVCESLTELRRVNELAKEKNQVANVALRINPEFTVRSASLRMGGVASQFGMDEEIVMRNKDFIFSLSNINIMGLHIYNGTRILQADIVAENIRNVLNLAERISQEWQINFSMVDVGGGIGVPYFAEEKVFDLLQFQEHLLPELTAYQEKFPATRIIIESGRYLVGDSGLFVCTVHDIKESRGSTFLVVDGGMNCHLTAAGYGSLVKRNFPISVVTESSSQKEVNYQIAGPLCTPADLIGRNVVLPEVELGDLVVLHASGAYGATASPVLFLSHGYPTEVLLENGQAKLIRSKDSIDNFLRNQILIN